MSIATKTRPLPLPSDQDASGRLLGQEEIDLVTEAIQSGTLTSTKGAFVKRLETRWAEELGVKFAYACSHGSAAVHAAVAAIDPEPGDEIITSPITDMGAITPILYQGAIPVFADVEPVSCNVTPESVARVISPRTKAVIVTHLFGCPADMTGINAVCEQHGVRVIEDCAQAFESRHRGQPVGALGDIGAFSLQQGKHITTGEGGLVVTNDPDLARRMFLFINKAWGYGDARPDHYFLALNYRMTELQGAVALAQLDKLPDAANRRKELAKQLSAALVALPGVTTPRASGRLAFVLALLPHGRSPADSRWHGGAWRSAQGAGHLRRSALYPKAGLRVRRDSRPANIRQKPLAVYSRPARSGVLSPRGFQGNLRRPGPDIGSSLERAIRSRACALHRRVDSRKRHRTEESGNMKQDDKMRFGLIGAGAIAHTYGQAFARSGLAKLVGVADTRFESARTFAEGAECQAFDCYRAMIERAECEAVVVATPPATHPEICCWLLDRGLHVLCEKPLAVSPDDARVMLDAAERSTGTLRMASKFRYVADVLEAKSIITSGLIGEVILFENAFTSRVDMKNRWNSDPTISGGGVLIDNGTHSVDVLRYFLGPIAELQVVEGRRVQDIPVEDTVRMFVRSAQGVMGTIDLSWSINKELPYYVSVYGSAGTLHLGWKESKFRRASDRDWTVFGAGYDKLQAFGAKLENFVRSVRGFEAPLISLQDALASVEAINTAYDAMWRSSWVAVGSDLSQSASVC